MDEEKCKECPAGYLDHADNGKPYCIYHDTWLEQITFKCFIWERYIEGKNKKVAK